MQKKNKQKIKLDTEFDDISKLYIEFNIIAGILMYQLDFNYKYKKKIDKVFPYFVKIVDEINKKMPKYSIKNKCKNND